MTGFDDEPAFRLRWQTERDDIREAVAWDLRHRRRPQKLRVGDASGSPSPRLGNIMPGRLPVKVTSSSRGVSSMPLTSDQGRRSWIPLWLTITSPTTATAAMTATVPSSPRAAATHAPSPSSTTPPPFLACGSISPPGRVPRRPRRRRAHHAQRLTRVGSIAILATHDCLQAQVLVMDARIREDGPLDGGPVVELSLRAWAPVFSSLEQVPGREIFVRLYGDWRQYQDRDVRDTLADGAARVWVAEAARGVVGFVAARFHPERHLGEVWMLAVDPDAQGRGIGTALAEVATAGRATLG